jgi:hypothetical protein
MSTTKFTDPGKKAIVTYDNTFLNADCLFIEFDDVIRMPRFMLLFLLRDSEELGKIFDLSEVSSLSLDELYEWYVNRKYRYVFRNLPLTEEAKEKYFQNDEKKMSHWVRNFEYQEYTAIEAAVTTNTDLNAAEMLRMLSGDRIVKNILVYSEYDSDAIREYLSTEFGSNVRYVHGKLEKVLEEQKVTNNSTFMLADMNKIQIIEKCGLLDYSSLVIPDGYGYNKELDFSIEELLNTHLFKIDFFDNFESLE